MDPLSKYKGRINGEKRLVENFKYEITCYKKDGKFIWTKQKISPPFKCAVCEQKCTFHYYGVLSCEACKQFFRRVVIKQKVPQCWKNFCCEITKGERCQGCRFNKCLLMGMDPSIVYVKNSQKLAKFIDMLNDLQLELLTKYYKQIIVKNTCIE
uniref:Nuclear receptor domain-containing protein n=1 Tax=Meloidogyne enterolobii TaxID=390850 RepID=A0A6V7WHX6_MELEN|nr:unnamed protein product [Meloidogyne enterolobii]CAD2198300.1 unnamed protein product [Meloidogyne enterolobii]